MEPYLLPCVMLCLIAQGPMPTVRTSTKLKGTVLRADLTSNSSFKVRRFPKLPSVFSGLAFIWRHRMW